MGDNPTDIDVTPNGQEAIAVARGSSELWIYDLDDPTSEAQVVPIPRDEVFGSLVLSPEATPESYTAPLLVLRAMPPGTDWKKTHSQRSQPVRWSSRFPRLKSAQTAAQLSSSTPKKMGKTSPPILFYNRYALTMVDLSDHFANPLRLSSEPMAYAHTDDGETGFVILDGEPFLEVLHYDSLLFDEIELKVHRSFGYFAIYRYGLCESGT